jgi:hypothetical protein
MYLCEIKNHNPKQQVSQNDHIYNNFRQKPKKVKKESSEAGSLGYWGSRYACAKISSSLPKNKIPAASHQNLLQDPSLNIHKS